MSKTLLFSFIIFCNSLSAQNPKANDVTAPLHTLRPNYAVPYGKPNIGATMFLRGINSLYATNQPLIIVDGIMLIMEVLFRAIILILYPRSIQEILTM